MVIIEFTKYLEVIKSLLLDSSKFMQLSIDEDKWINYYIIIINLESKLKDRFKHCVNSVHIRSYSGPHFLAFGLNTERYFASLHIQSKCRKMRTRITLNTDTFHAVKVLTNEDKFSKFATLSATIHLHNLLSKRYFVSVYY